MESNNADGFAEEASFTNVGVRHIGKSRPQDDRKRAASETSNLLHTSLSHDSSSENAQSKSKRQKDDPSYDDVEMPLKDPFDGSVMVNDSLGKSLMCSTNENDPASNSSVSDLSNRITSIQDIENSQVERLGDNLSCINGSENRNSGINDLNMESNRKSILKVDSSSASHGKGSKRPLGCQGISDVKDGQQNTEGMSDSMPMPKNSTSSLSGDGHDRPIPLDCLLKDEPSSTVQNFQLEVTGKSLERSNCKDMGIAPDHHQGLSCKMETEQGDCKPEVRVAASTADMSDDGHAKGGLCDGGTSQNTAVISSRKLTSDMSKESDIASAGMSRSQIKNENEKLATVLDNFEMNGSSLQAPQVAGSENDDSDLLEDDVKVCDICGDAGREDKLAICSRCSDGAEHIYCMRIMLDKIPEGDWLCEECQLKGDADKKKLTASENLTGISKVPSFNKKSQDIVSTSKVLPYSEGLGSRTVENVDASLKPSRKAPETNESNSSGTSISNPKSTLVRELSSKNLDASKPKLNNSGNQTATSLSSMHARSSIGPNTLKNPAKIQSPRGPPTTFSGKSKVQQATEKTSQKTKAESESDARKEHFAFLGKSASFKSTSTGFSNTELVSKHQATKRADDIVSSILDKQRSLLERSSANASPAISACSPYGNTDKKALHHEALVSDKGPEDLRGGTNEVKPQALSKSSHFTLTERPSPLDSKPYDAAGKEDVKGICSKSVDTWSDSSIHRGREGKNRDTFSSSRPAVPSSIRVLRCQKCNETGHSTQFCSIDKLRFSALKPSAERNSKDMPNKSNKWKDAVEAAYSKKWIQKSRLPDQPNEMSRLGSGSGCGIPSRHQLSEPSTCVGLPSASEGPCYVQDSLRTTLSSTTCPNDMVPQKHTLEEATCSRGDGVDLTGVSRSNSNLKISPELVLSLAISAGALVVPELDYIWKGGFTIQSSEKFSELCDVQAHLSTHASQNVVKVMEHFPNKVELTEIPCTSIWPSQFNKKSPTEENIALFFFATSTESYEKGYKKLLENMLKNDTVLTGSINGVDLLIIPSNKLPERSQRWNRMFFLWGVFRLKNPATEFVSGFRNKLSDDKLSAENSNQQLPCTIASPVVPEKEQSCGPRDKESPASDKLGNIEGYNGNLEDLPDNQSKGLIYVDRLPFTDQLNNSLADFKVQEKTIDKPNEISASVSHVEHDPFWTEPARQEDSIDKQVTVTGLRKGGTSPMDVTVSSSVVLPRVSTGLQPSSYVHGVDQKEIRDEQALEIKPGFLKGVVASSSHDFSKMEQNANLKRPYSSLIDLESNPDSVWENRDSLLFKEEREAKRIKPCTDKLAKDDVLDVMTSKYPSHPMLGSFINEDAQRAALADEQILPECSTSSEKVFFPVNFGHVELKPVDFIPMPVAADEPDVPDLELALGAEKKPKKGFFPLLFSLTNPQSQEVKPPDPAEMEEDANQSLSLSLAMPSPHKEQSSK